MLPAVHTPAHSPIRSVFLVPMPLLRSPSEGPKVYPSCSLPSGHPRGPVFPHPHTVTLHLDGRMLRGKSPGALALVVPQAGAKIPDYKEDQDAAHTAFMHAFEESKPEKIKIPGLQEFAGSIWERRRRIPSQLYNDPLVHLFQEFDVDNDGSLTAHEIAEALSSRGVHITPAQVQVFVDCADMDGNNTIEIHEFPDLIFHMASADLNAEHHAPSMSSSDEV